MKILFIGLGSVGQRHLRNLNKLNYKFEVVTKSNFKEIQSMRNIGVFPKYRQIISEKKLEAFKPEAVFICNNSSKHFETMKKYYSENSEKITSTIDKLKCGTDQTILNYMLHKEKIDVKLLPSCYNLQDMFKKSLLHFPGHSWWEDNLNNLYNSGWVYHFNSIPANQSGRDSHYWMERVYKDLYE